MEDSNVKTAQSVTQPMPAVLVTMDFWLLTKDALITVLWDTME